MRLFVDTCVWRHWLTLKNGRPFENCALEKHATDFDQIYEIVTSESLKHIFLYDARIEGELLSKRFSNVILQNQGERLLRKNSYSP